MTYIARPGASGLRRVRIVIYACLKPESAEFDAARATRKLEGR
jgi:hypothetical protein